MERMGLTFDNLTLQKPFELRTIYICLNCSPTQTASHNRYIQDTTRIQIFLKDM